MKILGLVSLAQDTGSEMLYPLIPTLLTTVLGAPVVAIGVAEGLADATAAGMKLVSGRLASTQRRRPWIAAGYALAALGKVIIAVSFVWPGVLLGRVVDRVGKGVRGVPRDALIADDTPADLRGRAFGLHRTLDTLGAVLGPLLCLALLELFDGRVRIILVIAIIPAIISVALVAAVREHRPEPGTGPASTPDLTADHEDDRAPLPRHYWRVLIPLVVFSLVNSTDALLLQRASELGLSLTSVVLVYVLYNVVYATLGYPAGMLADRFPPRLVFAAGLVVFAVVYFGLGLITSSSMVWVLLPCYGAYTAGTDGVSRAWISNLVPDTQRTWALGVHGGATSLATLAAGLWVGLAWGGNGRLALMASGVVALFVAGWLVIDRSQATPGPVTIG